jgi:ABC-type multidrug transport system fused ATPase/permease subunit
MAAVRLMPSVNRMSSALNALSYLEPALDKMVEHLTVAEEWEKNHGQEESSPSARQKISLNHKVELSDLTYSYPNAESPVLDHANMEITIGKSIGVVGASGAGKTTAIDILLGLLVPQQGQVLADGVDIQEDYEGWLDHIGYIPQMIFMLDDTIRANVAFGIPKEEVDEEQVWRALEEAQLKTFVQSLPDGLDTTIGERGVRLSGGQRQRIGIARALYKNPELLIFDEATSALDNETEAAIMESINALHGRKTLVIIAHRLTTIAECDIVYRVENGKITRNA